LCLGNAFSPRICAIEGEGEGLKLGDGEEGFEFFVRERKSGTSPDRRRKKKKAIKALNFFRPFFLKGGNCM